MATGKKKGRNVIIYVDRRRQVTAVKGLKKNFSKGISAARKKKKISAQTHEATSELHCDQPIFSDNEVTV